jgi:hypothetical protein
MLTCLHHDVDYVNLLRRISNERTGLQTWFKRGKELKPKFVDMAEKWEEVYGMYLTNETQPEREKWFDHRLLRSGPIE